MWFYRLQPTPPVPKTPEPDAAAAVNVREIRRTYDRAVKLPRELVEELARVRTRAQQVWQEAKAANDFPRFRPWLEKLVASPVVEERLQLA